MRILAALLILLVSCNSHQKEQERLKREYQIIKSIQREDAKFQTAATEENKRYNDSLQMAADSIYRLLDPENRP